jgi:hypothetical protein
MDPRGDHDSGNVRRGHSHVCCVDAGLQCEFRRRLRGNARFS